MTIGLLDGIARCAEHECPLLRVGDNYECIIERMDAHLGNKQVTDVIPGNRNTPVALVFDDGHTLPLLCPDCGGPIQVHAQDINDFLEAAAGLYLVGLSYHDALEEALGLGFAETPGDVPTDSDQPEQVEWLLVHVESARQLTCPG